MSKETLSKADELFIGKGLDRALENILGRTGAPFSPKILASLGSPAAADADFLIKAATSTELPNAETVTYTAATDTGASPLDAAAVVSSIRPFGSSTAVSVWDVRDGASYGRNIVAVTTHTTSVVAMTIVVSGYDYLKHAMTQTLTVAATGTTQTNTGTKAFAYVTSITVTAAGNAEANTLNLGTGARFGLPYFLAKTGHMTFASIGGAQELLNVASNATVYAGVTSTPSGTTGDVRGTITFNGTLNGTAEAFVEYYIANRNSGAGLVGVAQA
jgi:hypothetical protein